MEPCAPGTEDDPPITYSGLTKQEKEVDRLLNQKGFLKNGKSVNVFELSIKDGTEFWFCNVCECPLMGRVFQHELGRRHTQNMAAVCTKQIDQDKTPQEETAEIPLQIAPGEPAPPGFEDIGRITQIQERLDRFQMGSLVALEYLVELQDDDPTVEPYYMCILCDKKGDPRTVLTHLTSFNHISQYLQRHFPTCWRILATYNCKQYRRNWQATLQKIAEGIETKFGRLKPFPINKNNFEKDRMHYLHFIGKGRHFSESSGYTFEELVVHEELTKTLKDEKSYETSTANNWGSSFYIQKPFKKKSPSPPVVGIPTKKNKGNALTNPRKQEAAFTLGQDDNTSVKKPSEKGSQQNRPTDKPNRSPKRRNSLSSISSISDKSDDDNKPINRNISGKRRSRDRTVPTKDNIRLPIQRDRQPYSRRLSPPPRRKSPIRRRSPSPRRPQYKRRSPSPIKNRRRSQSPTYIAEQKREKLRKIEEFRKLSRAIENDMIKTLKLHEKNPEKHPRYNEEWKQFWSRRYKELKAIGVDVNKYDWKPEWIKFWNKRMVELHSDEVRSRKEALRKRLGLPDEINPIKFRIEKIEPEIVGPKPLPMAALPDQDNEVIIIDDKDDDDRPRSRSPWEENFKKNKDTKNKKRSPSSPSRRSPSKKTRNSPLRFSKRSRSRDRVFSKNRSRSKNTSPTSESSLPTRSKAISRSRDFRSSRSRSRTRETSFERDLRGKERIRTVADLYWERDVPAYGINPYLPPTVMRDVSRIPIDPIQRQHEEEEDDEGEVNVVDVLRILTALEDRLGSLGPKVVDLLAQALAMEKNEANSSEQLLDNEINCVFFETVKEKLKGHLFAGLVDHIQQKAFKKAIKKLASLIHLTGQRKRQREKLLPKNIPTTTSGVVDKAVIAKQIANALISQGKTDVTQAELEQLINAVVGMAEASKVSSKPVTTAGFLDLITSNKRDKPSDVITLDKLTEPLTPSPGKNFANAMENLSDSDLQTLLQNFKDLSTEEQHNLINYLKKLEYQEPERVEKLRKFVNLDTGDKVKEDSKDNSIDDIEEENVSKNKSDKRESPFSIRSGGVNPMQAIDINSEEDEEEEEKDMGNNTNESANLDADKSDKKVNVDSEEDEYTFEDVVKTVSKNVKDKEWEHQKQVLEETIKYDKSKSNLSSAKDLISELMSNITKNNALKSNSVDLLGLGNVPASNPPASNMLKINDPPKLDSNPPASEVPKVDLSKLLNINMASLASIVNNVKTLSSNESIGKPMDFKPPSPVRNQHKLNIDLGQLKPDPMQLVHGDRSRPLDKGDLDKREPNTFLPVPDIFKLGGSEKVVPGGPGPNKLDFVAATNPDKIGFGIPNSFGPGSSDKFGPLGPDRIGIDGPGRNIPGGDRIGHTDFGPGGPDRFGTGNIDRRGPGGQERFGPGGLDTFGGSGPDRFGPGGPDRFGPGGPDPSGPGGPDRSGPGGPDRFGPGGPDRFGPGGPNRFGPGGPDRFGPGGPDRFGPGGPDKFGPGIPDRFGSGGPDRFGPSGPDRFGPGGPDRFGPGGPDRFGPGGPDRFGPGGPDRFGPSGPDRFAPGGPDRFGPGGPDRFGPGGPDRFGPGGPDKFGLGGADRFGSGGPDRFGPGGSDRFGPGGSDRFGPGGSDRFGPGGPDRFGPGGPDRFGPGGPERFGPSGPDRFGPGGPDKFGPGGPDRFGPGGPGNNSGRLGPVGGPDRFRPSGIADKFGSNVGPDRLGAGSGPNRSGPGGGPDRLGPYGNESVNKAKLNANDQMDFPRMTAADLNRQGGNINRW